MQKAQNECIRTRWLYNRERSGNIPILYFPVNLNPDPGDSRNPFFRAFINRECIVLIEIPSASAKTFAEFGSPQETRSRYFLAATSIMVSLGPE